MNRVAKDGDDISHSSGGLIILEILQHSIQLGVDDEQGM